MKRAIVILAGAFLLALPAAGARAAQPLPSEFLGITPQTRLDAADTEWMKAAGIGSLRVSVLWAKAEPRPDDYDWTSLDVPLEDAARAGISVTPFLYGSPAWVSPRPTNLPVGGAATDAWVDFLTAAVRRFGPGGSFWAEHPELPELPVRRWQIWNEPNFFYFTTPASPARYAKLLRASYVAIKSVDPDAEVIIGGLFGKPREGPPAAMRAASFLERLYRIPDTKHYFDGVALHPYAAQPSRLAETVSQVRRVSVRNRDRGVSLYITEIGWGSEAGSDVAFEVGPQEQARRLRQAYRYLIRNRLRLRLRSVYWFTWKDVAGTPCRFCDSTGLFYAGDGFLPKPAWAAFLNVSKTPVRAGKRFKRCVFRRRPRLRCGLGPARPARQSTRRSSPARRAG